ncbi:Transcription factor SFP1 [Nakaseomyces bracarensis]|uniref:Transcription factor SFP1 n=1 Tax=Nakaseomyces bracarensis TaxID=273131 RepID=A0ABR4NYY1_9SACH
MEYNSLLLMMDGTPTERALDVDHLRGNDGAISPHSRSVTDITMGNSNSNFDASGPGIFIHDTSSAASSGHRTSNNNNSNGGELFKNTHLNVRSDDGHRYSYSISPSNRSSGMIPMSTDEVLTQQQRPSESNGLASTYAKLRRESIAHSQGIGGVSWGSLSISSWLRDEVMLHHNAGELGQRKFSINNGLLQLHMNPPIGQNSGSGNQGSVYNAFLPNLEEQYCKDYSCCGISLPGLHDLLRHYEEAHISTSPIPSNSTSQPTSNDNPNATMSMKHLMDKSGRTINLGSAMSPPTPMSSQSKIRMNSTDANNYNKNKFISNRNNASNLVDTVSTNEVFLNNGRAAALNNIAATGSAIPINKNTQPQALQNMMMPANNGVSQLHSSNVEVDIDEDEEDEDEDEEDEDEDEEDEEQDKKEVYIDDPARRLYVMDHEEYKPFKCPVVGCDKTYKNQNGLKYHRLHGHQNQTLRENPDGTFNVIDPESNEISSLDALGNDKDKPYRCEVCGKRYKNLNGLKYHRGHSTH